MDTYEAYVEFCIPLTVSEHCFEKRILEAEVVVKRETKGRRIVKKKGKINLQYYLWWKIKKRESMQKIAAGKL